MLLDRQEGSGNAGRRRLTASIIDENIKLLNLRTNPFGRFANRRQIGQVELREADFDIRIDLLDVVNHRLDLVDVAAGKDDFVGAAAG